MVQLMTDRLTKADWISHGLRTLAADGPGGLKAGPMAAALKVSRGSFYWHFRDIADFRAALLRAWQARTTDQVISELDAQAPGPVRLKLLLHRAFDTRPSLDRAVRAWAAEDRDVAAAVAGVDARRIAYIAGMLADAGVDPARAAARATFLYWAWLGQGVIMDPRHAALDPAALDAIGALFST
jgi:AcrR family transcriptional regulator